MGRVNVGIQIPYIPWNIWDSNRYTLWLFNIAMENDPFIVDVPSYKHPFIGDFPWLNNQMVSFISKIDQVNGTMVDIPHFEVELRMAGRSPPNGCGNAGYITGMAMHNDDDPLQFSHHVAAFSEMGVPLNHPFEREFTGFSILNDPFWGIRISGICD